MAGSKRNQAEILENRAKIANLYLKGWQQKDIAVELGLSPATVSRDIKALIEEWRQSAISDIEEAKAKELARINRIEREAWEAWEASKQMETGHRQTTQYGGEGQSASYAVTRRASPGDTKYMDIIRWCIDQRCKLLGLNAPDRHEHSGPDGGPITHAAAVADMTDAELMEIIAKGRNKSR